MPNWTTTEVAYLSMRWGLEPATSIAQKLNKSVNAVCLKASKLNLKSSLPHKGTHSLAQIAELIEWGYHPTEIARELNISSTKNVYNTVRDRLGGNWYARLKQNAKHRGRMRQIL